MAHQSLGLTSAGNIFISTPKAMMFIVLIAVIGARQLQRAITLKQAIFIPHKKKWLK